MASELFESATHNAALVREVVDAVDRVAASRNLRFRDAPDLIRLAAQDPGFKAALASALGEVAERHRLSFTPEVSAPPERAAGEVEAFIKSKKSNPTQLPNDPPIALLFVGAALIFMPSIFRSVGGTMFGIDEVVSAVEGLAPFS